MQKKILASIIVSSSFLLWTPIVPQYVQALEGPTPYGAGPDSLGGAVVAMPREDSVFSNPAFLSLLDKKTFLFSGSQSFDDRQNFQGLAILPTKFGGYAAGFSRSSVDGIPLRDSLNRDTGAGQFYNQKISLGTGFRYRKILGIGAGLNLASMGMGGDTYETKSLFDVGLIGYLPNFNVGVSILRWGDKRNSEVRFGLAREGKASVSAEMVWPVRFDPYAAVTVDYQLHERLSGIIAYHSGPQDLKRLGLASGIGFGVRLNYASCSLDYAFSPMGDLGMTHRFALVFRGRKKVERSWRLEPILGDPEKRKEPKYYKYLKQNAAVPAVSSDSDISAYMSKTPTVQDESPPEQPNILIDRSKVNTEAVCSPERPELYVGELDSKGAAQAEFDERVSLLKHDAEKINLSQADPYLYADVQTQIAVAVKDSEQSGNPVSGFRSIAKAEAGLAKYRAQMSEITQSRQTAPEKDSAWNDLVQDAVSHFSVLSREVRIEEKKDILMMNLDSLVCMGGGRFSAQTGTLLTQIAKFLKKYRGYPVLIDVSGSKDSSECAKAIETFLYNERVDAKNLKSRFTEGAPSARVLILKNLENNSSQSAQRKSNLDEWKENVRKVTIFFDRGTSEVPPEYASLLSEFGSRIKGEKSLSIVVAGYTDIRGDETYRNRVALCRAQKVVDILVQSGIPANMITVNANGNQWVTDNSSPETRARNRRADITFKYMERSGE